MENREKVPVRYRKNAQTAALLDTLGLSAQQMANLVEDVKKQFFIETATWSLPLWEQQVGISPPTGATEASRRSALKARLLAGGNTTADTIRDMATAMTGYAARVIMNDDYSFTLEFLGETDDLVELDLSSLTDSVNLISPAHLRFIIAGLTWERFEAVNMTWQKLEDMNMTWERLEESVPIVGTKQ